MSVSVNEARNEEFPFAIDYLVLGAGFDLSDLFDFLVDDPD